MKYQLKNNYDKAMAIVVLLCLTALLVGLILGINYMTIYGIYSDKGETAKAVALETNTQDDIANSEDYYYSILCQKHGSTYLQNRINNFRREYSKTKTSFFFVVYDESGKRIFCSYDTDDSTFKVKESDYSVCYEKSYSYAFADGVQENFRCEYCVLNPSARTVQDKYTISENWIELAVGVRFVVFAILMLVVAVILFMLTLLTISAGHNVAEGIIEPGFIDKIPLDICIIFSVVSGIVAWATMGLTSAANVDMVVDNVVIMIASLIVMLVLSSLLMTIAVRVKLGNPLRNTLIYRFYISLKRQSGPGVRKKMKNISLIRKLTLAISGFTLAEIAIITGFAAFAYIGSKYSVMEVFKTFIVVWGLTRIILIPIGVMLARELYFVWEEGRRIASGNFDKDSENKITIKGLRAHSNDLDAIRKEIASAVDREVKSERLRTELITNVSHDLKTPLTAIIAYSRTLSDSNLSEDRVRECIKVIDRQSEKLSLLLDSLIDVSKLTSGVTTFDLQPTNVPLLIEQSVDEFYSSFSEHGITPITEINDSELTILAEGQQLWRVISNLFGNACKYAAKDSEFHIGVRDENGKVIMEFSNLSAKSIEKSADELQDRFVRDDSSRNTEGNGLGLSISKSLTEMMGGTFEINVEDDKFCAVLTFDKYVDEENGEE